MDKRLTIIIDEDIRRKARIKAMMQGTTLKDIITQFLLNYINN